MKKILHIQILIFFAHQIDYVEVFKESYGEALLSLLSFLCPSGDFLNFLQTRSILIYLGRHFFVLNEWKKKLAKIRVFVIDII